MFRPFRARVSVWVPLTQAVGLGFVRSPLCGSKTAADFAGLGFVLETYHSALKRRTKPIAARSSVIHLAGVRGCLDLRSSLLMFPARRSTEVTQGPLSGPAAFQRRGRRRHGSTGNPNELTRTLARRTKRVSWKGRSAGERALRYCERNIGARIVLTRR